MSLGSVDEGKTSSWYRVCQLSDLEPLWGEAALVDGAQVALVRLPDDRIFAVSHWDPIAEANVMARGIVGSKGIHPTLASPINKRVYDLESGQCLSDEGPALDVYDIRLVDERVEIYI